MSNIVFYKKLNFIVEEETDKAIKENKDELARLSNTKFKRELDKMVNDLGIEKVKALLSQYKIDDRKELS